MKYILVTCFLCFNTILLYAGANGNGKIEGEVIDRDTKQPIAGAVIDILDADIHAISGASGVFEINGLDSKTYHLKISAAFYNPAYKTDIKVGNVQSSKIIVEMITASYETKEVVVEGGKLFEKRPDFNVSANSLSSEEIRRAPGAVEDLNRMMQTLPGVTTATDSRNDLVVRGGSPVENLIIIDGIEVPNINHFGTQGASGGPIGMVNVDFLSDVSFSAGGFPAKYGDRLSSMMDVQYRNGDRNALTGKFDLGIAGAGIIIEGPIQKGKSSFIFSGRKSYLDLILSATGLTAVPNYTNFNFKADYEISKDHKLSFLGLGGIDKINFGGATDDDDPSIESTDFSGWQAVEGVTHKWLIGRNTYLQTSISSDQYERNIKVDSLGKQTFMNESVDAEFILRTDLSHRITSGDLIEAGTSVKYLRNDNSFYRSNTVDVYGRELGELNYSKVADAYKAGSYIQFTKNLLGRLDVTAGIRHDYYSFINDKNVFSPRISTSYSLFNNFKINAAYGLYYQAPPLLWLVSYHQNKNLKQIKTNQVVTGIEYYPSPDIKITVEYFDKKYSDYPASVINPEVTYANAGAEYDGAGLEPLVAASTGYAKGIEFFIQKKLSSDFYGMLNYSYSQIKFKALDGIERSSSFDYGNVLTIILGYKVTDNFEISAKYRYMGGKPYTPFNKELSSQLNQTIYDYARYNGVRQKDYQRMDIRFDYRVEFNNWNLVTFLDLQNAFNIENIDQIIWNQKTNNEDKVLQWKFLPAGGIKIEF